MIDQEDTRGRRAGQQQAPVQRQGADWNTTVKLQCVEQGHWERSPGGESWKYNKHIYSHIYKW